MKKPLRTPLAELIEIRTTRRDAMKGILAAGGAMTAVWCLADTTLASTVIDTDTIDPRFQEPDFPALPHVKLVDHPDQAKTISVAEGYRTQVLISWGDPLFEGAERMDFANPNAADQIKQFGYNNDFIAFMPLEKGSENSRRGLLCVNNEYTNPELMFSGVKYFNRTETRTDDHVRIELAAHGHSIIEIQQDDDSNWQTVCTSPYNRRITMHTPFRVAGPAAGHGRMKTEQNPNGREVLGTISNCSGGVTPWGTVLSGEENIHFYFLGNCSDEREAKSHARLGIDGKGDYAFHRLDDRFDLSKTPNEPNRFGWVVEIDPYDPQSVPVKRTALGRFKHEGAATTLNHDGRVVVYSGDDEIYEYLYKFVSDAKFDPQKPSANKTLLDRGTLYAARFEEDGTLRWLPLVHGHGPLTWKNNFSNQGDVLIETRRAADFLGATPMDRPEDVEENPVTHNVFVVLTKNLVRSKARTDPSNPRPENAHGHIIELEIPQVDGKPDHAATEHRWNVFLLAGRLEEDQGWYQEQKPDTWLSCPDNIAFDKKGRLWIATDGLRKSSGIVDGAYVCEVDGPRRALTKQFFQAPTGSELCGPCFTPDNTTLFVGVQHPGEYSTFDIPSTRWPNPPDSDLPPQPSVVAITRKGGGPIGG